MTVLRVALKHPSSTQAVPPRSKPFDVTKIQLKMIAVQLVSIAGKQRRLTSAYNIAHYDDVVKKQRRIACIEFLEPKRLRGEIMMKNNDNEERTKQRKEA